MTTAINTINSALSTNQQNIIGLTETDFEAYPLFVELIANIQLSIDLKIEKESINSYAFILGSPIYGIIGTSRLGINSTITTQEELVNI